MALLDCNKIACISDCGQPPIYWLCKMSPRIKSLNTKKTKVTAENVENPDVRSFDGTLLEVAKIRTTRPGHLDRFYTKRHQLDQESSLYAESSAQCFMGRPYEEHGPVWLSSTTLGHHQAETYEIGRPLCETPRAHGQRDNPVGTNAWEEVQGKRYCHGHASQPYSRMMDSIHATKNLFLRPDFM